MVSEFRCNCNDVCSVSLRATLRHTATRQRQTRHQGPSDLCRLSRPSTSGHADRARQLYRAVLFVQLISARRLAHGPTASTVSRARTDDRGRRGVATKLCHFHPKIWTLNSPVCFMYSANGVRQAILNMDAGNSFAAKLDSRGVSDSGVGGGCIGRGKAVPYWPRPRVGRVHRARSALSTE